MNFALHEEMIYLLYLSLWLARSLNSAAFHRSICLPLELLDRITVAMPSYGIAVEIGSRRRVVTVDHAWPARVWWIPTVSHQAWRLLFRSLGWFHSPNITADRWQSRHRSWSMFKHMSSFIGNRTCWIAVNNYPDPYRVAFNLVIVVSARLAWHLDQGLL